MALRQMRKRIDKRQAGSQTFRRPGGTDDRLAIQTSRGRRTGQLFGAAAGRERRPTGERDDGLVEVAGRGSGNLPRWIRLRGRAGQAVRLRVTGYDRRERLPADGQEGHRGGWRQVWRRGEDVRIEDRRRISVATRATMALQQSFTKITAPVSRYFCYANPTPLKPKAPFFKNKTELSWLW